MKTVDITKMASDMGIKAKFLLDATFIDGFALEDTASKDKALEVIFQILDITKEILTSQGGIDKNVGVEFALDFDADQATTGPLDVKVTFIDSENDPHLLAIIKKQGE